MRRTRTSSRASSACSGHHSCQFFSALALCTSGRLNGPRLSAHGDRNYRRDSCGRRRPIGTGGRRLSFTPRDGHARDHRADALCDPPPDGLSPIRAPTAVRAVSQALPHAGLARAGRYRRQGRRVRRPRPVQQVRGGHPPVVRLWNSPPASELERVALCAGRRPPRGARACLTSSLSVRPPAFMGAVDEVLRPGRHTVGPSTDELHAELVADLQAPRVCALRARETRTSRAVRSRRQTGARGLGCVPLTPRAAAQMPADPDAGFIRLGAPRCRRASWVSRRGARC